MARKLKDKTKKPIVRKLCRRRISIQDVEAICEMVSMQLTETEACLNLNINPQVWRDWKRNHKHESTFSDALTRIRGTYIAGNLAQIRKAATGSDGVRHDWRAADRLNGILARDRYGNQDASAQVSVSVNVVAPDRLKQLVEMLGDEKVRAAVGLPDMQCKAIEVVSQAGAVVTNADRNL